MWMQPPGRDPGRDPERDQRREDAAALAVTMIAGAALLAVLWPVAAVMAVTLAAARATGMHHARILRAALWSLSMTGTFILAATVQARPWSPGRLHAWLMTPYLDWKRASLDLVHGRDVPGALLSVAPLAVPAGLAAAAGFWAWRRHQLTNGLAGSTALTPVLWDERQWKRQARTAARDARQPGRVPLLTRRGIPAGTVIRTVRARWSRVLAVPLPEFARHMVIVGATGSGKTTLMIRLWAGWAAAALRAARDQGEPWPLLIIIDAKGGFDSRLRSAQARSALAAAGITRFGLWPDTPLSMWDLAPDALSTLLHQLIEHGDGAARYYADMSQAVIRLAVMAPGGPPRSSGEFLERLSAGWLQRAYAEVPAAYELVSAARQHLGDIVMRYSVLLGRLGPSLNGGARLEQAEAWYCILEGTAEPSVAEAQAMALIELVARTATAGRRRILLAADDYSAVSRRVPLSNLYERGRSLGLGVQVSAQSWEGLGADDDERRRITSTADGGIWLLRTPSPEPLVSLAGTVRVLESGRKLLGAGRTGDEGTSRVAHTWTVDPDRIRQLETGQAAYISHGSAVFVHVTPAPAGPGQPEPGPAGPPQLPARPPAPQVRARPPARQLPPATAAPRGRRQPNSQQD